MPESELEQAALRVRELEQEALAMHERAQKLNKEGKFAEAQAAYAAMHALEDEASALAARVGCVACVLGDAPSQDPAAMSLCSLDPQVLLPYQQHHPAVRWGTAPAPPPPAPSAGAGTAATGEVEGGDAGGGGLLPEPLPLHALRSRALGCVVGSSLADAAAMGVHWVYDLDVLARLEEEAREQLQRHQQALPAHPFDFGLEFLDPPRSPFYAYASGRNSPYGEQTLALLRSLAERRGLSCDHYAELFAATFGEGFDGYRDVSTKGFLRNYARGMPPPLSGADDAQANAIARLAPLVAAFGSPQRLHHTAPHQHQQQQSATEASSGSVSADGAGDGGDVLMRVVPLATRVTQNTDAAAAWAAVGAAVLEAVAAGGLSAEAAVRSALRQLTEPEGRLARRCGPLAPELAAHVARVLELRTTHVAEATAALGRNCHMPNALQTPLQVVLYVEHLVHTRGQHTHGQQQEQQEQQQEQQQHESLKHAEGAAGGSGVLPPEAYVWGVRLALREGGCCASRAAYVGAMLGAMVGREGLPEGWLAKYAAREQVAGWAEALCDARG